MLLLSLSAPVLDYYYYQTLKQLEWKITFLFVQTVVVTAATMVLLLFQIFIMLNNFTTKELFDMRKKQPNNVIPISPYSVSISHNVREVLGVDPSNWFSPLSHRIVHDGYEWATRPSV
eukprot:TRINITY_DN7980_c0_g1_i1.p1 TRINITY_DN7980_c0_g1~~TRINITY_DN7980_c0_g1_i1.p1  ORF type:complete len:118 (-),score=11.14 TRINITY_DN7980_c0_g1_i1:163-516(-)